jgi:hypothetical protein
MNRRSAIQALLTLPATASVTRLSVTPKDLIVISFPGRLSPEHAERIRDIWNRQVFPEIGCKCVVLEKGATISVVRRHE